MYRLQLPEFSPPGFSLPLLPATNPLEQLHISGVAPAIKFEDNVIQSSTTELTSFVIRADNGAARLISDQSVGIFINGDNNENNRFFAVMDNSNFFGGNAKVLFQVNENGDADLCGRFRAKKLRIEAMGCDFVFEPNYQKMQWKAKADYYKKHRRMPYMDSAAEMEKDGLDVGKNFSGLLLNAEEDRLDITELFEKYEQLQAQYSELNKKYEKQQEQIEQLGKEKRKEKRNKTIKK